MRQANVPLSGARARSAEASAPTAGWAVLPGLHSTAFQSWAARLLLFSVSGVSRIRPAPGKPVCGSTTPFAFKHTLSDYNSILSDQASELCGLVFQHPQHGGGAGGFQGRGVGCKASEMRAIGFASAQSDRAGRAKERILLFGRGSILLLSSSLRTATIQGSTAD